ncbi:hypothetical protein Aeqsu_1713 [Aequorivita sublithincola DSM 14238]|uniref:Pvc16 N-terminal domain-containing protein n=1 Tax=Aequorivita sublithincola (strain DSM 14238 / LMG 21431 / ACAM 643 / 9-3) TaxID=746697 RepID=I3YW25_AEQSU|nr:DUF4255 domain-containing protein [Aequorivita sublithincola]AFL81193.1 hypothetical protein Aeqsu_1713 [Aequorivita sublithincola DSM 14238]
MIDKALSFITDFLNQELKRTCDISSNLVIASGLVNPDGSVSENIQNKIVISVINLENETFPKSLDNFRTTASNTYDKTAPPVYLNLYLLISANYDSSNYLESLKMLSTVITSFHSNSYFTKNEHPNMPSPLEKLTLEIYNVPITELSHIWNGFGAKYVPSVVYKLRMITL